MRQLNLFSKSSFPSSGLGRHNPYSYYSISSLGRHNPFISSPGRKITLMSSNYGKRNTLSNYQSQIFAAAYAGLV